LRVLNVVLAIIALVMIFRVSHMCGERLGKYLNKTYGSERSIMDD